MNTEEEIKEAYADLRLSLGWKLLVEELEYNMEAIGNIANVKGIEDLSFRQGQLSVIRDILSV